jgi:hypothetical protein
MIEGEIARPKDFEMVRNGELIMRFGLQITEHRAFGGRRWTDDNTMAYIRRLTADVA